MRMLTQTDHEELLRLAALVRTSALDTAHEPEFDRIAEAAKTLFGATAGMVTFVGQDRQFYKGRAGPASTSPRRRATSRSAATASPTAACCGSRTRARIRGCSTTHS